MCVREEHEDDDDYDGDGVVDVIASIRMSVVCTAVYWSGHTQRDAADAVTRMD